ncbi:MAG: glutathione S-transferase family protein [Pseudomonadales bacterium]|jgi:glutathione S-transferase
MAITIYGSPHSRTTRALWMATELNLEYEHVSYEFDDPRLKQPEYLSLNPAGTIPTMVDGDFALSESLAINLYLAKKYSQPGDGSLYPDSIEQEASAIRWCLFAQGHIEPWVQKDLLLADLINAIGRLGDGMINRSLGVLDRALADSGWLVGERFSVADLNVAGILSPSRSSALDLSDFRHVQDWLTRCYSRPAAVLCRRRFNP